jgi:hypothetical protein
MALTIDYLTYVISVPKADTQFVETNPNTGLEIREINIDTFGKALADVQDDQSDVWAPTGYEYTPPATIGGIQLAPVLLILSPYTITFEDGQYAVNLVGGNTNMQDFVNVNQVSIRPNNSAGNTFSSAVNSQSYIDAEVTLDTGDGETGVAFTIGTPPRPSNNLSETLDILIREGLHKIKQTGFITATVTENLDGIKVTGGSGSSNVLVLSGTGTDSSDFEKLIVTGAFDGLARITDCILGTTGLGGVTGVEGRIKDSIINHVDGVIQDATGAGTLFDNCVFVTPNDQQVTFNANGNGFGFRDVTGNILITNVTKVEDLQVHIKGAIVELASSCTAGSLTFTGSGTLIDNSNGTTVIDNLNAGVWTLVEKDEALAWSKKASDNAEEVNLKIG